MLSVVRICGMEVQRYEPSTLGHSNWMTRETVSRVGCAEVTARLARPSAAAHTRANRRSLERRHNCNCCIGEATDTLA